jgi:hypothetical protein
MLGAQGLWAGRDLYRATSAVTRGLGFSGLIRRAAAFSRLLRHTRGLIDWLFTVLRPAQEFFTYIGDVTIAGEGLQNLGLCSLSRKGSLSFHTCCNTGPRFFRSHPKDRPIKSPLTTRMGIRRTYSNLDPHGITQGDVDDLF